MGTAELQTELTDNADVFAMSLNQMAVAINADISQVIRKGVLDTFKSIIKRSPVKTGAYRGSHGIANMEPDDKQGAIKAPKGGTVPPATPGSWTWKVGDGDIWLYNNVPYAERLEDGWSKIQAPAGIYRLALVEMTVFMQAELVKFMSLGPTGDGGE